MGTAAERRGFYPRCFRAEAVLRKSENHYPCWSADNGESLEAHTIIPYPTAPLLDTDTLHFLYKYTLFSVVRNSVCGCRYFVYVQNYPFTLGHAESVLRETALATQNGKPLNPAHIRTHATVRLAHNF